MPFASILLLLSSDHCSVLFYNPTLCRVLCYIPSIHIPFLPSLVLVSENLIQILKMFDSDIETYLFDIINQFDSVIEEDLE